MNSRTKQKSEISESNVSDNIDSCESVSSADLKADKRLRTKSISKKVHSTTNRYDDDTTMILTQWFLENRRHPYPSVKIKAALAEKCDLSYCQVSDWFTNKRKRHWTPVFKKNIRPPRDWFESTMVGDRPNTTTPPFLDRAKPKGHHYKDKVPSGSRIEKADQMAMGSFKSHGPQTRQSSKLALFKSEQDLLELSSAYSEKYYSGDTASSVDPVRSNEDLNEPQPKILKKKGKGRQISAASKRSLGKEKMVRTLYNPMFFSTEQHDEIVDCLLESNLKESSYLSMLPPDGTELNLSWPLKVMIVSNIEKSQSATTANHFYIDHFSTSINQK